MHSSRFGRQFFFNKNKVCYLINSLHNHLCRSNPGWRSNPFDTFHGNLRAPGNNGIMTGWHWRSTLGFGFPFFLYLLEMISLSRRKSFYLNKFCSKPLPNYLTVGRWLPSLKFSPSSFPYQELPVDSTVEASKDFALLLQRRVASAASVEKMQKTSRFCTMLLLGQVRKLELVFFF